ncbi:MAG TPA: ParB/RepB/Spo0J family partition protein [Steroidobacteraceae bacterium]
MTEKKRGLGRGLEAPLGQVSARPAAAAGELVPTAAAPAAAADEQLARIPLDLLQRGRYQPRLDLRPESLQELADSIRAQGVVQPIVVRPLDGATAGAPQRYEIIAGERRWRAAQMVGLPDIPAIIRRVPDDAAIAMSLIENIQRENLNPLEEARALDRLITEFGVTHQQAADAVGRSRVAVSNLLRLLELSPEVCELVETRAIEMGHARALLALTQRRQQAEVGSLVAKKGLSVRDTEALVRRMMAVDDGRAAAGNRAEGSAVSGGRDPNVRRLEDDLAEKLGAKVAIQHSLSGKGKLVVSYNSLDELDGILAHIH